MRRIIPLTLLALMLSGGVALADRDGRGRGRDHQGGVRVAPTRHDRTPDRGDRRDRRYDRRADRRNDRRADRRDRVVRVQRARPAFRNNRFYFAGGVSRPYVRPVVNVRYRDYNRRPAIVVENYDAMPGYVWIQGGWQWTGYEWSWQPGRYDVDVSYQEPYDDGAYYDDGYDSGYVAPTGPAVQGGVTVQGSWGF